jgi:poly(hydroxyalkanoate) depolymerase family esterase
VRRFFLLVLSGCALAGPGAPADGVDAASAPDARMFPGPDAALPPGPDAADTPDAAPGPTYEPVEFEPLAGNFNGLGAYLHVPPGMPENAARPLVLVLHGCWEDATVHAGNSGWNALADTRRVYVVHAEESVQIQQCFDWWSSTSQAGGGDVAGVLAMIDAVAADYNVDADHVYVAGFSAGAAMAVNVIATHPERFAGGIVSAALPFAGYTGTDVGTLSYIFSEHDLTPAQRAAAMPAGGPYPPLIAFVGSADTTVHSTYTRELVDQWTAAQGADQTPDSEGTLDPDADHTYRTYVDGTGRLLIATITLTGMSHGYAVDPTGTGPDAGGAIDHELPGKPSYGKDVHLWFAYWGAELLGL